MIFLDTTVLVGAADVRDDCHDDGKAALTALASGKHGTALTTDYVLDETLTILGSAKRGVGAAAALDFVRRIMSSPRVKVHMTDSDDFNQALADYQKLAGSGLSFTDTMSVIVMRNASCTVVCSHDAGFGKVKGIKRRLRLEA